LGLAEGTVRPKSKRGDRPTRISEQASEKSRPERRRSRFPSPERIGQETVVDFGRAIQGRVVAIASWIDDLNLQLPPGGMFVGR